MQISIIENDTGKLIGNYEINLEGINYTPSDEEYFSEAWQCAVEDGIVDTDKRDMYSFILKKA